jgi:glutamine amidotransferase
MIAIIKYNAGNSRSVQNAVSALGFECAITDDRQTIQQAEKVIFPGVGEASTAMNYLRNKGLDEVILNLNQPFLGICLGLQLLCDKSEEGNIDCLGIFNTKVKKFPATDIVPHIGWDNFERLKGPLFNNISENQHQYFLHSYYAETCAETTAVCKYIVPFSAALRKDNFYAAQFHPEKSGEVGKEILRNFLVSCE